MSDIITADQIRELWDDPNENAVIDRGDDYAPVPKADLGALASEIDTDDEGRPLDDQWDVLADQLNSWAPGEPTNTQTADVLQEIIDARRRLDQAQAADADAATEFNNIIRAAVRDRKAAVTAIAAAAGLSRERIYQIRDRRR